jgi:predicted nucleic acid-binding protein
MHANVVFSVLIKGGKTLDIFILNRVKKGFDFAAPEFLMVEVEKHNSEIIKKTGLSTEDIGKVLDFLEKEIEFVSPPDSPIFPLPPAPPPLCGLCALCGDAT